MAAVLAEDHTFRQPAAHVGASDECRSDKAEVENLCPHGPSFASKPSRGGSDNGGMVSNPPPPRRRRPAGGATGAVGRGTAAGRSASAAGAAPRLSEREIEELEGLLEAVPAPLEPLDLVMLDGYLCGVLVQPRRIPIARWLGPVFDVEARPLPKGFEATRLRELVQRRHAELDQAIGGRRWFDPWVFEVADDDGPGGTEVSEDGGVGDSDDVGEADDAGGAGGAGKLHGAIAEAVFPWAAGMATAFERFPDLTDRVDPALDEPLALVYRYFAAEDLEDAAGALALIEALAPPQDLTEAVEDLVRATLLLADIGRPLPRPLPFR